MITASRLKNNGTAVSWGDNPHFASLAVPPGLSNLVAVAGGESYNLALKNSGTVVAWGVNNFPGETNVPPGLSNVVTIASGTYSSLALENNGTVVAWVQTSCGLTNVPAGFSNAVALAGGSLHSLAIKNDGTVVAWGDDSAGQTDVPAGLTNVVGIAAGTFHSLALKSDGTVVAWGDNSDGQTNVPAGLTNVVAVAAGGFNSLALKNDGSMVVWGFNSFGQTSVPAGLTNVVAIAAGYLHSLALTPQSVSSLISPVVLDITNGVPQTTSIFAGGVVFYKVNVPTNADFATNSLLYTLNGPLNVWLTTNTPPTIATINDSLLFGAATDGVSILSTTSMPTNIVPGSAYYLGVQNTNSFAVTYGIEVDFHLLSLTNPIFISGIVSTNIGGTNGFLLTWFAPSNDLFQVQWSGSLSPTIWTTFTNIVSYNPNAFTSPLHTQFNFFDDGAQFPFGPARFYQLILLQGALTNGVPQTNSVPAGGVDSFLIHVPTNADFATNLLLSATGPLNVWFDTNAPSATNVLLISGTNGSYTLSTTGTPPLASGSTYYLSVQNTNSVAVNFGIEVDFHLVPAGTTNSAPVLPVQGTRALYPLNALVVTNAAVDGDVPAQTLTYSITSTVSGTNAPVINPTNGIITWTPTLAQSGTSNVLTTVVTDDGVPPLSATNEFAVMVYPLPALESVVSTNGGFLLTWYAPSNYLFQVQWSDGLPALWQTFTNPPYISYTPNGIVTATNVEFTFFDDGSQTGGFSGATRYYQLILLRAVAQLTNVPVIVQPTSSQTAEIGSSVDFYANAVGFPPLTCLWFFNGTNFNDTNLISSGFSRVLKMTNVDLSASGTYFFAVTNIYGAVTSAPFMLNVLVPVQRMLVSAIDISGQPGSVLGLYYSDDLGPATNWQTLTSMTLAGSSQFCFDVTTPLPPYRYYRVEQPAPAPVIPSLTLNFVPAITLTGNLGSSWRLDYINQFGPIDAWIQLDTITLTNTSEFYFDTSVIGQPSRLYRVVPLP